MKGGVEAKRSESLDKVSEKILAALEQSHRFFADLLEMFSRVDYRTIAAAVGQLHQEGKITQDGDGKYQVRQSEG